MNQSSKIFLEKYIPLILGENFPVTAPILEPGLVDDILLGTKFWSTKINTMIEVKSNSNNNFIHRLFLNTYLMYTFTKQNTRNNYFYFLEHLQISKKH